MFRLISGRRGRDEGERTTTLSSGKPCPNGGGHGHPSHGGGGGPANETPLTGDTKTSAENAALAAVPDGTVRRSSTEDPSDPSGASYEVHVTKSDGSEVEVLEDSSFKVLSVEAGKPGPHGGPKDDQGN